MVSHGERGVALKRKKGDLVRAPSSGCIESMKASGAKHVAGRQTGNGLVPWPVED